MKINSKDIEAILKLAKINGFDGHFHEIGAGEVNRTFKVLVNGQHIILRIAKDKGQTTLENEARAIKQIKSEHVPRLIYFNKNKTYAGHQWILESCVPGSTPVRLNKKQYESLGVLLAQIHSVKYVGPKIDLKNQFLKNVRHFGNEEYMLKHPDKVLRKQIIKTFSQYEGFQTSFDNIDQSLLHLDVTPSNTLVDGDRVGLIDWEFAWHGDPMSDFSTIYYEDVEYNRGKWRVKIKPEEKAALFKGYKSMGGIIYEDRIKFWIRTDKLGACAFLYWRINQSDRETSASELKQYKEDYYTLVDSLQKI